MDPKSADPDPRTPRQIYEAIEARRRRVARWLDLEPGLENPPDATAAAAGVAASASAGAAGATGAGNRARPATASGPLDDAARSAARTADRVADRVAGTAERVVDRAAGIAGRAAGTADRLADRAADAADDARDGLARTAARVERATARQADRVADRIDDAGRAARRGAHDLADDMRDAAGSLQRDAGRASGTDGPTPRSTPVGRSFNGGARPAAAGAAAFAGPAPMRPATSTPAADAAHVDRAVARAREALDDLERAVAAAGRPVEMASLVRHFRTSADPVARADAAARTIQAERRRAAREAGHRMRRALHDLQHVATHGQPVRAGRPGRIDRVGTAATAGSTVSTAAGGAGPIRALLAAVTGAPGTGTPPLQPLVSVDPDFPRSRTMKLFLRHPVLVSALAVPAATLVVRHVGWRSLGRAVGRGLRSLDVPQLMSLAGIATSYIERMQNVGAPPARSSAWMDEPPRSAPAEARDRI